MQFQIPQLEDQLRALGIKQFNTTNRQAIFIRIIHEHFKKMYVPEKGDWLSIRKSKGQSFETYIKRKRRKISKHKKVIYIQALENDISQQLVEELKYYCKAFYCILEIKILDAIDVKAKYNIQKRINKQTGQEQYNAYQIIKSLECPKNGFCIIGIMMSDIYNKENQNFILGVSKYKTGVFSFYQYLQPLHNQQKFDQNLLYFRCCKTLTHEIGHLFGLKHCIYYTCLMNGSSSVEETFKKPADYCPLCIKKLQSYQELILFLEQKNNDNFQSDLERTKQIYKQYIFEINKSN